LEEKYKIKHKNDRFFFYNIPEPPLPYLAISIPMLLKNDVVGQLSTSEVKLYETDLQGTSKHTSTSQVLFG